MASDQQDQYRAEFDAEVFFSNGGGLRGRVPGRRAQRRGQRRTGRRLFIASLGLLMTEKVRLHRLRVFAEPHKGTRGGPSDTTGRAQPASWRLVDLSHAISAGMTTYPGLPGPEISPHLTRQASREIYAEGTEFAIDRITMVGNTGTYLDRPLSSLPRRPRLGGGPAYLGRRSGHRRCPHRR